MTLSDKIWDKGEYNEHLTIPDVKEFIKKLKEAIYPRLCASEFVHKEIDKLAGKELI